MLKIYDIDDQKLTNEVADLSSKKKKKKFIKSIVSSINKNIISILEKRREQKQKLFICPNCRKKCNIASETYIASVLTLPMSSCCNFIINSYNIEIIDELFKLKKKNSRDPCLYCDRERTIVEQIKPFNNIVVCFTCYGIDKEKPKYFKSTPFEWWEQL